MVHNHFIKCQVCGAVTRIRLQVGYINEHPINVACGHCGTTMNGKVLIGQETPELKYSFENADEVQGDNADYVVECSGEFPTLKPRVNDPKNGGVLSPFMRFAFQEGYAEFTNVISKLNGFSNRWPQYKRIIGLFERDNHDYMLNEIWKVLPKDQFQCRNEFEISRAVHMIEVIYIIGVLRKDIISDLSLSGSVLKLSPDQVNSLIDFLNSHEGYSLKELQAAIYKTYDEFILVYSSLIPAIFLQYCDKDAIDFDTVGTTTSSFDKIKQFSLNTYETLGNLLVVPVALNNIKYRNNYNQCYAVDDQHKTLDDYVGFRKKVRRYQYCTNTELYTKELRVILNSDLRNAIGHNDVEYDTVLQKITYTPNPSDRTKQEKTYLLEFENEAVHLFQAITVISEYLYRLREFEMIKNGNIPLPPVPIKKVGRNKPCPCGSGLKYKKCHGR